MENKIKYRFLWKLAGEDKQILENCSSANQLRFALSGLLIALLFIVGLISYHHTFMQLFNIPYYSWVLGLLFTLMIFNIYKLNLITITSNQNKKGAGYFIALCFRICFMLLLGLTIIKPIETLILRSTLALELAYLKVDEINEATIKTSIYFDEAISVNDKEINRLNEQLANGRIEISTHKLDQLQLKNDKLLNDRNVLIKETENRIDASPHYVRGLILLNTKFSWVWLISIGFLFVFLIPLFLKYFISQSSPYAKSKSELDREIILDEYQKLKYQYPLLFQKSIGKKIALEEQYEDPPFNLIPKVITRATGKEEDFLKYLNGL